MSEHDLAAGQRELSRRESGWTAGELIDLFVESLTDHCPEFTRALVVSYLNDNRGRQVDFLRNGFSYEVTLQSRADAEPAAVAQRGLVITRHSPVDSTEQTDPIRLELYLGQRKEWGTITYDAGEFENTPSLDHEPKPNSVAAVEMAKTFLQDFRPIPNSRTEAETGGMQQPSLETILDQAKQRFVTTETTDPYLPESPKHGKFKDGYTFEYASGETARALLKSGVNMQALAGELMQVTSTSPKDIDDFGLEGDTWETISTSIVKEIIYLEMPKRFPELVMENERRMAIEPEE